MDSWLAGYTHHRKDELVGLISASVDGWALGSVTFRIRKATPAITSAVTPKRNEKRENHHINQAAYTDCRHKPYLSTPILARAGYRRTSPVGRRGIATSASPR